MVLFACPYLSVQFLANKILTATISYIPPKSFIFRHPSIPLVVVGNKSDLERKLPHEETELTVTLDWESGYVECSSLGENSQESESIFRELLHQFQLKEKLKDAMKFDESTVETSRKQSHGFLTRLFSRDDTSLTGRKSPSFRNRKDSCKVS